MFAGARPGRHRFFSIHVRTVQEAWDPLRREADPGSEVRKLSQLPGNVTI